LSQEHRFVSKRHRDWSRDSEERREMKWEGDVSFVDGRGGEMVCQRTKGRKKVLGQEPEVKAV
jgi:hypothetical protein